MSTDWLEGLIREEAEEKARKRLEEFISSRVVHEDSLKQIMNEIDAYIAFVKITTNERF